MKIRVGFVSNSSSSSFVVLLDGLSEEVRRKILSLVDEHNNSYRDGYLFTTDKFVFGKKDDHDESGLSKYVSDNVSKENWSCKC